MEKELIFWLVLMVVLLVIELIIQSIKLQEDDADARVAKRPRIVRLLREANAVGFPVDAVLYQTVGDEIYPAKEGKDELRRGTGEGCAGHRACRQSQRYRKSNV